MLRDGMRYFCDCCPRCVDTKNGFVPLRVAAEAPHAAEVIGELAHTRAVVAQLKASLSVVVELWDDEKRRYAALDNLTRELDCRVRAIEHKLNLI
jgi:hypothetical protein